MQRQIPYQAQVMPVSVWLLALLVLCWIPLWLYQMEIRVSADAVWLTEAARRALDGYKMSDMYFDNNPPMCYLIYTPVVFLVRWGMTVWNALSLYTGLILTVSFALSAALLRRWPGMTVFIYWSILSSWLFAVLAPTHLDFAQKDYFIALALLPFMLGQLLLTYRIPVSRWLLLAAFLFGVPFLLIKPHFGLMPVLMLVFRAWKQRRISVFRDSDFIVLTCGVIAYVAIIAIFFMDYITEILPFGLLMYALRPFSEVYLPAAGILIFTACYLGLAIVGGETWTHRRIMAVFLCVMSFTGGLIFLVQLKGFHLHLFPAYSFIVPAIVTTSLLYFPRLAETSRLGAAGVIILFAILGYGMFAIHPNLPTHKTYAGSSMARYLKKHVAPGSSFYLQMDSANVIVQVSAYTGIPIASRFPQLWFFAGLEEVCDQKGESCRDDPRVKDISVKIAEDIARWKPAFIGLYAYPGPGQHLLKVVGSNPAFQKEWRKYRRQGQFVLNYREYSTKPLSMPDPPCVYDIYVRE